MRGDLQAFGAGVRIAIHALVRVAIVIILALVILAFATPIAAGYHFGCDTAAGDNQRLVVLGIQMCRKAPAETTGGEE
jgi:hypothetical protein